jgi:hypothetical protein
MTNLELYKQLEQKLREVRIANDDKESPQEDAILDEMETVWFDMTIEEHHLIETARLGLRISIGIRGTRLRFVYENDPSDPLIVDKAMKQTIEALGVNSVSTLAMDMPEGFEPNAWVDNVWVDKSYL